MQGITYASGVERMEAGRISWTVTTAMATVDAEKGRRDLKRQGKTEVWHQRVELELSGAVGRTIGAGPGDTKC